MADIEKTIYDIERCICHVPDACRDCSYCGHGEYLDCMEKLLGDALELLKEQPQKYASMVVSWLREIALNNVDCNREMTFLDAVEDIRDRASYGLAQYFKDTLSD